MKRSGSAARRVEVWARWARGETVCAIARAVGVSHPAVGKMLRRRAGMSPPVWRRSPRALSSGDREEISRGLAAGTSFRALARQLGRAPSTLSREVRRHGGRHGYRARPADAAAWRRARRPKRCRLADPAALVSLCDAPTSSGDWAPQQIAAWLRAPILTPTMHVSHETIYRTLFIQARGALQRDLMAHLRRRRVMRRSGPRSPPTGPLWMRSRSARGHPASRIGRCLGTGKATCSRAPSTPILPHWSSGIRATSCWSARRPRPRVSAGAMPRPASARGLHR